MNVVKTTSQQAKKTWCEKTGPVKKVYLGVLFWCTSEKGVLILTLNGEKGVLFSLTKIKCFYQNKMLLPK